jgi:thiol-disulfide isomerase/thioredoxin
MRKERAPSRRLWATGLFVVAWLWAAPSLALQVGDPAPTFKAPRLDGSGQLALADLHGKVVLVDFWASWCGPCQKSMPQLDQMQKEFPADRFVMVGVNVDKDLSAAKKALEKRPVSYLIASDPAGSLPARYGLETMPTAYLIDGNGAVRYVHRGFRDGDIDKLREEIQKLLAGRK